MWEVFRLIHTNIEGPTDILMWISQWESGDCCKPILTNSIYKGPGCLAYDSRRDSLSESSYEEGYGPDALGGELTIKIDHSRTTKIKERKKAQKFTRKQCKEIKITQGIFNDFIYLSINNFHTLYHGLRNKPMGSLINFCSFSLVSETQNQNLILILRFLHATSYFPSSNFSLSYTFLYLERQSLEGQMQDHYLHCN